MNGRLRPADALVFYQSISARMTRGGQVCLYWTRVDVSTGRLVTVALDEYLREAEDARTPSDLLADALRLRQERLGTQLTLW